MKTKRKKTNKAAFVRGLPRMPAQQVVDEGAKKGISLTPNYVYKVRNAQAKTNGVAQAIVSGTPASEVAPVRTENLLATVHPPKLEPRLVPGLGYLLEAGLDLLQRGETKDAERYLRAARVLLEPS